MKLRHATPRANMESITREGLLPSRSQTKHRAVWLHQTKWTLWAISHVAKRHNCRVEDVVIYEVDVPSGWLTMTGHGVYFSRDILAPERLKVITTEVLKREGKE